MPRFPFCHQTTGIGSIQPLALGFESLLATDSNPDLEPVLSLQGVGLYATAALRLSPSSTPLTPSLGCLSPALEPGASQYGCVACSMIRTSPSGSSLFQLA
jgi:hypothetical protein